MNKVLVTGGTGFIGRYAILPLLARGYEVHVTSRHAHADVTTHHVDLLDLNAHEDLINHVRPSHLLHAAWYTENGKFWNAIDNISWLQATISLASAFYKAGGKRLLGLGTCAEYDWSSELCVENVTPEVPSSLYGKTKRSAYECLTELSAFYQAEFAWARIFFPYGPGEPVKRLIPYVITHLLRDEDALCTHGNQLRDFMHVSDMGDALAAILDANIHGAVNVGSGVPVSIREVVMQIAHLLGKENRIKLGMVAEPLHSPAKILASVNRLQDELKWSAKLSLHDGLSQTIAWWQETERARLTRGVTA
jgi:nucleoside-diphosphate-sugar epimerase